MAKSSSAGFPFQYYGEKPSRPPFSRGEILCHYCKKPGHINSSCMVLKGKEGKSVALLATRSSIIPVNSLLTQRQPPKAFKGFVSEGGVAIRMGGEVSPISILRDTGATQSLMVQGVIDLPPTTEVNVSTPVKGVGGGFVGAPLHRVFLKSNIINGPVVVAIVPSLPVEGIDFVLGNDLAGTQVCSNFTSGLFQEVMHELGIKQVMYSAYHPQSQGAIEHYHQTLKTMIKTYTVNCPGDWDVAMPFLLFAIRDSVNKSTGFSPFELVYGVMEIL